MKVAYIPFLPYSIYEYIYYTTILLSVGTDSADRTSAFAFHRSDIR